MKTHTVTDSEFIPTEGQVLNFFKHALTGFQQRLHGYAMVKLEVTRHATLGDDFVIEWGAYHNDTGHCAKEAGTSLESAINWHFGTEVVKRQIQTLRAEADEKIRKANELEASI